jgi:hypothetical protein
MAGSQTGSPQLGSPKLVGPSWPASAWPPPFRAAAIQFESPLDPPVAGLCELNLRLPLGVSGAKCRRQALPVVVVPSIALVGQMHFQIPLSLLALVPPARSALGRARAVVCSQSETSSYLPPIKSVLACEYGNFSCGLAQFFKVFLVQFAICSLCYLSALQRSLE